MLLQPIFKDGINMKWVINKYSTQGSYIYLDIIFDIITIVITSKEQPYLMQTEKNGLYGWVIEVYTASQERQ